MNCVVIDRAHWDAEHPMIAKSLTLAGYTVMVIEPRDDLDEVYLHCETTEVECAGCGNVVMFSGARYPPRTDLVRFEHVMTYPLECPECGARAGSGSVDP